MTATSTQRTTRLIALFAGTVLAGALTAVAQTPAAPNPWGASAGAEASAPAPAASSNNPALSEFAAVSIRLFQRGDPAPDPDQNFLTDPAGLKIFWAPFRNIIAFAYNVYPFQIMDGPEWLNRGMGQMYDLSATTSAPATRAQQQVMLRQALAQRLGLKLVRENRPVKVYALIVAKGGPKLHALDAGSASTMSITHPPGLVTFHFPSTAYLIRYMTGAGAERVLKRPLVDDTGLTGRYDLAVALRSPRLPGGFAAEMESLIDAVRPFGLEFKPMTQMTPVYVVQSVHRPTPN